MKARMRPLLCVLLAMATPLAHAQNSVALHRTARLEPGRPIVLGDLATVAGDQSERLASLVVAEHPQAEPADPGGWFVIDVERVRASLEAHLGDKAGLVALTGSACSVQITRAPAATATPEPAPDPVTPDSSDLVLLPTVRGAVARELCRVLGVAPDAVRMRFEPGDDALLDTPTDGRTLEIAPTGASDRMPVSITIHQADGRMTRQTIGVDLEVRRTVAVARRTIERNAPIGAEHLLSQERWLPPGHGAIEPAQADRAVARRRIDPGETLDAQSIQAAAVIRRGDRVSVRVITGRWVVRREAHALDDGREGEQIEFAAAADSRQRFRAIVTGRGQAAVWSPDLRPSGTGLAKAIGGS